ncbi:M48 family metallopeptidase [Selenomonadales bacterium OttesenSCG-928-I06]|nr:M48 family metallopeptidase [Selenomonadales bacterium OttesenSCG-928-I06]
MKPKALTKIIIVENIEIEITRKKIKNIYLKVKNPEGKVTISAPRKITDDFILQFVNTKLDWIKNQQKSLKEQSGIKQNYFIKSGEIYKLWGNEYTLNIIDSNFNKIELENNVLNFYVQKDLSQEKKKNLIKNWYKKQLTLIIFRLIPKWEKIMDVNLHSWTIRHMKTRWGSCNHKQKKITLNLSLVQRPIQYLEYIIVHELAHLKIRNHKKEFWDLVANYIDDAKILRKDLNSSLKNNYFLDEN